MERWPPGDRNERVSLTWQFKLPSPPSDAERTAAGHPWSHPLERRHPAEIANGLLLDASDPLLPCRPANRRAGATWLGRIPHHDRVPLHGYLYASPPSHRLLLRHFKP